MKLNLAIVFLMFTTAMQAMTDGKMYSREEIPPHIPYQRALILFEDGIETLILQSKYNISGAETESLGWVVPVPSAPEVASLPANRARSIFERLGWNSQPRVWRIKPLLFSSIFFASLLILLIVLILSNVSFLPWFRQHRDKLTRYSLFGLLASFLWFGYVSSHSIMGSNAVDVISAFRAGIYDVRVVRSSDAEEMILWLNENEFQFGLEDKAAFEDYVSKGWCFVVANINPSSEEDEQAIVSEGLAAPLILRFPHENPIYPVALTGTGDHETEILIYLAADSKMSCNERLPLRFAGKFNRSPFFNHSLNNEVDPEDFFEIDDLSFTYLCKFKGILTPAEMTEDIVFTLASDDTDYRENIIKW